VEKKKSLIYLMNYLLVQRLEEEIYHNMYAYFAAEHSIHRQYVYGVCFRWLASSACLRKRTRLMFMACSAKYSPLDHEL